MSFSLRDHTARKAEFERLHHDGRILLLRFADQQMNMLGHDDIAHDDQFVTLAHLLQHLEKEVAAACRAQQRLSAVATACDEMKVTGSVVPL